MCASKYVHEDTLMPLPSKSCVFGISSLGENIWLNVKFVLE